jgi:hypothetical protein
MNCTVLVTQLDHRTRKENLNINYHYFRGGGGGGGGKLGYRKT